MPQITSGIIYRGPSLIDGAPIVVVATYPIGHANRKTGAMLQTYIMPDRDEHIMDTVRLGYDVSVCGGCPHRYAYDATGVAISGTRTCYVNLSQGVRVVREAVRRGSYRDVSHDVGLIAELGTDRMVRLGTWGDPAAVPAHVWAQLLAWATGHTGYTHQWRSRRIAGDLAGVVMASCETAADVLNAHRKGWNGTFRVRTVFEGAPAIANLCPASEEAGKVTTCSDCRRCNGIGGDVEIVAHGTMASRYTGRRLPVLS